MKIITFAKRNIKEILRDPLSLVFCFLFPVIMLLIFQAINHYSAMSIPWFNINILMPGIMTFSLSFVMLYMAILVSKDKTLSFLDRLYSSPMKITDFILGYMLPGMIIAYIQIVLCCIVSVIIGSIVDINLSILAIGLLLLLSLPMIILMVLLGILVGITFSDKAASGISSIIINIIAFLGGAWVPLDTLGRLGTICKFLPFYPNVIVGRAILNKEALTFNGFWLYLLIVLIYALVFWFLTLSRFKRKKFN
jgi:ABC-2 type transport system permease protein